MLKADNATVEWEDEKKRWEVHLKIGAEVIKRPLALASHDPDQRPSDDVKSQAVALARDEGYELDPSRVVVAPARRSQG
jgi:hypothetical protein